MPGVVDLQRLVQAEVEAERDRILAVSRAIHARPELGLREYEAAELLCAQAEELGFQVQRGAAGLETAFVATFNGPKKGPRIAFLAEYDAVPGLGHACGHNVIAAASLGAALALKKAAAELGGSVILYGTPDEEAVDVLSKGGKVVMARAGLFDGLDAVLMTHPRGGPNSVWGYSFPLKDFVVRYLGKPAHYTAPEKGINALEALLMFIDQVNGLKRGWPTGVLFAYTITDGGGPSPIVIPRLAEAHFTLKAFYSQLLEELFAKVEACARSAAALSGAGVEIEVLDQYRNSIPNLALTLSLHRNLRALGAEVESPIDSQRALERRAYPGGSTDFGDVSWLAPGSHGYCSIGGRDLVAHTEEFAAAAGGEPGDRAAILWAKALALTGVELLAEAAFTARVRDEFEDYRAQNFLNVPGIPPAFEPLPGEFVQALAQAGPAEED